MKGILILFFFVCASGVFANEDQCLLKIAKQECQLDQEVSCDLIVEQTLKEMSHNLSSDQIKTLCQLQ